MNKIWLIFKREYLTRVRNRTFILSTFLFPLVIVLFIAGTVFLGIKGKTNHRIAVIDANNYFKEYLKSDSSLAFVYGADIDTSNYEQKGCTAVLIVPELKEGHKAIIRLKYKKQLGVNDGSELESRVNNAITDHMIFQKTNITRNKLDSIRSESDLADVRSFEDNGKEAKASSQGLAYGIGYASGLLIYILTFVYGAAVMRGVMEEKTNRIAEVIVSSVKPFQLMFGKITGIGAVGLTQFLMWIILIIILVTGAQAFISHETLSEMQKIQEANNMGNPSAARVSEGAQRIFEIKSTLATANWGLIVFCFLFYFLGGYLFYSSLFASVGSVVNEDPQEAQSLMLPITMPIIFSFIIMSMAVQDPSGPLAVWGSMIPFSSPIVMMARIPYGVPTTVPWWQLALSMALLVAGFLFTTWMAGKIYRTGILMYGKKPSWKTMWKWAMK
ncbi:MAG: ABC transporter permease [Bacteroidetes bacterium]|nr:ABC transporter permease [Bacteroidota bacterium]